MVLWIFQEKWEPPVWNRQLTSSFKASMYHLGWVHISSPAAYFIVALQKNLLQLQLCSFVVAQVCHCETDGCNASSKQLPSVRIVTSCLIFALSIPFQIYLHWKPKVFTTGSRGPNLYIVHHIWYIVFQALLQKAVVLVMLTTNMFFFRLEVELVFGVKLFRCVMKNIFNMFSFILHCLYCYSIGFPTVGVDLSGTFPFGKHIVFWAERRLVCRWTFVENGVSEDLGSFCFVR